MSDKVTLASVKINPEPTYDQITNRPDGALVIIEIDAFVDKGMETELMLKEVFDQALDKMMQLIKDYKPGYNPATTYLSDNG
jgi:hypothetical protein